MLTNGYSAEFGRASGGVINTVTRSGGNDVHGTGYWFFRNQDFNALDRYTPQDPRDPTQPLRPEETRHQAGGSISGPILKDKLFYFFNAEVTRRDFPLVNRLVNPACSIPTAASGHATMRGNSFAAIPPPCPGPRLRTSARRPSEFSAANSRHWIARRIRNWASARSTGVRRIATLSASAPITFAGFRRTAFRRRQF